MSQTRCLPFLFVNTFREIEMTREQRRNIRNKNKTIFSSKPTQCRITVVKNDNLNSFGGMCSISLDVRDDMSDKGKEILESRGLNTDLESVEQFIVQLTVGTCSMDELTSHIYSTTGRLNGGIGDSEGNIHNPFYGFSDNKITGKSEPLTDEKMDDMFRKILLYPVVCYYWTLKKDDTSDPTQTTIYGGNKGEIDYMIKVIYPEDYPRMEGVIFGNTRYRKSVSGSVIPFVMKMVKLNETMKGRFMD